MNVLLEVTIRLKKNRDFRRSSRNKSQKFSLHYNICKLVIVSIIKTYLCNVFLNYLNGSKFYFYLRQVYKLGMLINDKYQNYLMLAGVPIVWGMGC